VRWRGWGYEDISRRLVCAAVSPAAGTDRTGRRPLPGPLVGHVAHPRGTAPSDLTLLEACAVPPDRRG
jgi:hypothetical protein